MSAVHWSLSLHLLIASSCLLKGNTAYISLQYDPPDTQQGFLVGFDLSTNKVISGWNASFCYGLWPDPTDATGDTLYCLSLQGFCDKATQCSEMHKLSLAKQTDVLQFRLMPDMAPFTVDTWSLLFVV